MAEEILGISGNLDISDIERSITELVDNLDKIGVKTDVLSKRMSDAMREIANSTDDSVTKQKRAMDILSQGIAEAKAALANYPEQMRLAKEEIEQTEVAIGKLEGELSNLNTQFEKATIGTKTWDELKTKIASVQQQLENNNALHQQQVSSLQEMEAGYNGLISMYGVANTATAANAVAHGAVTAATTAEAGAHTVNAESIGKENEELKEGTRLAVEAASAQQGFAMRSKEASEYVAELVENFKKLRESGAPSDELLKAQSVATTAIDNYGLNREDYDLSLKSATKDAEENAEAVKKIGEAAQEATQSINDTKKAEQELNQEGSKEPTSFRTQWNTVNELHDKIRSLTSELRDYQAEYDRLAEKPGFDPDSKKAQELAEKIANLKKEISDAKKEMSEETGVGSFLAKFKNQLTDVMTGNGKFQESLGAMKTALGGLVAPFTAATSGAVAFTKALWSMAATPIGAVLSTIVLALQALFMWFKKSADGQRAFAKISAYVGSLLSSITDIAVKIGNYLYHAFADPQGALNQFGKGLVGMVVNPLKAVGNTLAGVGKIAKGVYDLLASGANVAEARRAAEEIAEGWGRLKDAGKNVVDTFISAKDLLVGQVTGAAKLIGEGVKQGWTTDLINVGSDALGRAQKAAQLAEEETNAQIALSEAKVKEKQLDIEIANEREKIYTLTGKEKDAQIEKVKNLLKEKYDDQISAQKTLLRIQQERNKLHTNSLEDLEKEREAQRQVYTLEAQRASSTRMLVRMQQSNLKSIDNDAKKDAKKQQQIAEADARYTEIERKNALARAKAQQDIEEKIADARIDAMQEGAEKVIAAKKRQHKKELENIDEQRKAAIEAERNRQRQEFEAVEKIVKARGGKTRQWDESMVDMSEIDKINRQFEQIREYTTQKQQNDEYKKQLEAMRDYLQEYGTLQQKRYAITKEYADKIAQAEAEGNPWKVKQLQAEKERKLSNAKANELSQGIDFSQMTYGMSKVMDSVMRATYKRIQDYKETDEYKNSKPESKKAIADLENQLVSQGVTGAMSPFASWKEINKHSEELDEAIKRVTEANKKHEEAERNLAEQEEKLERMKAISLVNPSGFLAQQVVVEAAKKESEETGQEQKEAQQNQNNAANQVRQDLTEVHEGLQNFQNAISQITSGSLMGFADGVSNLVAALIGDQQKFGKGLTGLIGEQASGIVGAILTIIDALGDKPVEFIDNLFESLSKVIEAVISNIPQIIGSVVAGIGDMVGSIFTGIGGIFGFGSSDNHEEMLDIQSQANDTLERINKNVTRISEKLDKSYGANAIATYDELKEYLENAQKQYNIGLQAAGWDNYGGGESEWRKRNRWQNEFDQNGMVNRIKREYDLNFSGSAWQDLFSYLATLQDGRGAQILKDILYENKNMTDIAAELLRTNSYDEGAIADWVKRWADSYDEFEEAINQLGERLTTTTLENVLDEALNYLYDFADGAEDIEDKIVEDWQKMVNRMMINNMIGQKMREQLTKAYEEWSTAVREANQQAENNAKRDAINRANEAFKSAYDKVLDDAMNEIQLLKNAGVIQSVEDAKGQQSATANAIENISYDQADSLVGIGLNHTILLEQSLSESINQSSLLSSIDANMQGISAQVVSINEGVQMMLDTQSSMNSHLAEISLNTRVLPEMRDEIVRVRKLVEEQ